MTTYFSTCITGLQSVAAEALKHTNKDVRILQTEDGVIIYQTQQNIRTILQLPFFNNTYLLLKTFPQAKNHEFMMKNFLADSRQIQQTLSALPQRPYTFRIMATHENQFVAYNPKLRQQMEKLVEKNKLFKSNRSKPDVEFTFAIRKNGKGYLLLRLTKNINYERELGKGELYPQLAYLLCLLSKPTKNDVFLDPCAGFGSIPFTRIKYFPAGRVLAGDNDESKRAAMKQKAKRMKRFIAIEHMDVTNLSQLNDQSINKIVTDPPWKTLQNEKNLSSFYQEMITEFQRVLVPHGLLVLLTENTQELNAIIQRDTKKLTLCKRLTTLVSGRKALISVYQK